MTMTLEEAIKHCYEVAEEQEKKARKKNDGTMSTKIKCEECAKEHRQLAKWLEELKARREELFGCVYCKYFESDDYPCKECDSSYSKFELDTEFR